MAKAKYVKLGDKANSFYDPISTLKVLPGQMVELTEKALKSKKVINALRQGHLSYTDSEDEGKLETVKTEQVNDVANTTQKPTEVPVTKESLMKLNKAELVKLALDKKVSYLEDESEEETLYTQEELESYDKKEIADLILEED